MISKELHTRRCGQYMCENKAIMHIALKRITQTRHNNPISLFLWSEVTKTDIIWPVLNLFSLLFI